MAPPRKPLTTYSRRSRARAASKADAQASSPLQPLPTDMEDVTVTEMARRMHKRSRQSSSIAESGQQIEEGSQKAKKAKNDTADISEAVQPSPVPYWISSTLSERMTSQLPIQPSQMPETLFCTPCPSFYSEKAMLPSSTAQPVCPEQGDFSPLPAARHMLSRTSSRHLKENCLRALGSPFDSRPPSRIASPSTAQMKGKRKGKGKAQRSLSYAKSRTFSVPADPTTMDVGEQGLLVHGERKYETKHASSTQVGQPRTSHHRTGSIPTVSSIQTTHNWLAHPAALSKASGLNASPTHSSFFLDVPNGASTPPRKRRATTGMRIETQDYDITLSDMSMSSSTSFGAYTQAESHQSSPESDGVPRRPPLRMRRRTITDPSGGSLFSSVLDFSGSAAEEQRASVALDVQGADSHRRTTSDRSHRGDHAPLATAFSALNVGLASAFTPAVDTVQTTHGHALHRSASLPALNASPQPSCAPSMTSYDSPGDLGGLDSSDTQLRDLFTTLQLGGDEDPAGVPKSPHLETSEFGSDIPHAPLLSPALEPAPIILRRQQTHKRQRADTIRASDFVLPSSENPSGGISGRAPFQDTTSQRGSVVTDSASRTRRTRSGTVTLASVATSRITTRPAPGRTGNGPSQEPALPLRGHERNKAGWPMIQSRTNDEPLKLAPGDDEDDELLLKRGSTID